MLDRRCARSKSGQRQKKRASMLICFVQNSRDFRSQCVGENLFVIFSDELDQLPLTSARCLAILRPHVKERPAKASK